MAYSLTLRKEAESDVTEAFQYYEEKREGLGYDFLLCIEQALEAAKKPINLPYYL